MSRILVISFSDLARDPRLDRQLTFLRTEHEVVAAGWGKPADEEVEYIDLLDDWPPLRRDLIRRGRSAVDLVVRRAEPVYWRLPFIKTAFQRLASVRADLVIANDLQTLPVACWVAGGAPVIFDAHEVSADEHGHSRRWRLLMAPYADGLLRAYLPRVAGMMTVGPGLAAYYKARYGVDAEVVTSAPWRADLEPGMVGEPIRLIHHGAAVPQRQLELMIRAMDLLDDRFELTLMLLDDSSSYLTRLKRMAESQPRVSLIPPVPQRAIVQTCNAFDVGVALFPPVNDNLRYVLPNKLFEFIQARLAIVIGPSVDMAQIVREHHCGVVSNDFTPESLAAEIAQLTPERIMSYKRASNAAAKLLSAEANRDTVLSLVERALTKSS
jgi:hypothetical protein